MVEAVKNPNEVLARWLEAGLSKPGKDVHGVARAIKLHPSAVYKLISGDRFFQVFEIPAIASYLGEPVPWLWDSAPKK